MEKLLEHIFGISLTTFVVVGMANMGLQLTFGQIVTPLKKPAMVLRALAANFLCVPIFVALILAVIPVSSSERIGLILLAVAAGAPFLPKLVEIAALDIGHAIGLMLQLMLFTVLYLPLALPLLLPGIEVDSWAITRSLLTLMILPLLAALTVNRYLPRVATVLQPPAGRVTDISLALLVISLMALNYQELFSISGPDLMGIVLFLAGTAAIGWLMAGPGSDRRIMLSLGTGQRNIAAAALVASTQFPGHDVILTLVEISIIGLLLMLPCALWLGRKSRAEKDRRTT